MLTLEEKKDRNSLRCKSWRKRNRDIKSKKDKEYQELNKESISINKKQYYLKNREKLIKNSSTYKSKRRKEDILYNLKDKLRTQISVNLIKRKYKKSKTTEDLLGTDIDTVKKYLESLFKDDMNWENHGTYGWHIDHKIPLASAKNQEDVYKLFHYLNLQPLWCKENLSKGSKII